jgi:hypothetical protein
MNFPMESPIFQFFYWLVNTVGIGGIVVGVLATSLMLTYASVLLWISNGANAKESETFTYPTSSLHDHLEGTGRTGPAH